MLRRSCFKIADLSETTNPLCNPNRGFYQIFSVKLGETVDYDTFKSCLVDAENLVLLMVDISNYSSEGIDAHALLMLKEVIRFFVEQGKHLIVRAVYDCKGQAETVEPTDFELVKEHLRQILLVIDEYADCVFIYQGLLIGNWGEMHGSRYMAKPHLVELCEIADGHLSDDIFLCVRKPAQYRMLRTDHGSQMRSGMCRVGLFNDAILASDTDMGTYGAGNDLRWDAAWSRAKEFEFMDRICAFAPNGGEAVYGDGYVRTLQTQEIIDDFQNMHLTYLNRLYDTKMLDYFKTLPCKKGVWKQKTLYDYIAAHLGYRFCIENVTVTLEEGAGKTTQMVLSIDIANHGFANLYEDATAEIIVEANTRKTYAIGNLRDIASGQRKKLCVVLGQYDKSNKKNEAKIYLAAHLVRSSKMLQLANAMTEKGVFLGTLSNYKL